MTSALVQEVQEATRPADAPRQTNYLNASHGLKSWLLTGDHKRIAMLYLIGVTFFFAIGGLLAFVLRLELLTPSADLMAMDTYNKVFTMHGIVMIFFVLIPAVPAVLGNFLIPLMVGARDLAFPRINLLSWYCFVVAGLPQDRPSVVVGLALEPAHPPLLKSCAGSNPAASSDLLNPRLI